MNAKQVNPEMLVLARESRGLTQAELAQKTGIGQSLLSKYEHGMLEVSDQVLTEIATALNYPESLFSCSEPIRGLGSSCMHYRKRQSLPVRDLKEIQANANLAGIRFRRLLLSVEIQAQRDFPRYDIADYGDARRIAMMVRNAWGIPLGPIKNLVATIERAGGIVLPLHFQTRKLDAVSQWPDEMPPLFFINMNMPWDHIRFSLAHEIGHIIMHMFPGAEQEQEADLFASELLMPSRDIAADLGGMSLVKAAQLKPYWRVSMQALIRRAYDLGKISKRQYSRLFTQLSRLGYRINEPVDISPEEPETYRRLIDVHLHDFEYTVGDLSRLLYISPSELDEKYLRRAGGIGIVK